MLHSVMLPGREIEAAAEWIVELVSFGGHIRKSLDTDITTKALEFHPAKLRPARAPS